MRDDVTQCVFAVKLRRSVLQSKCIIQESTNNAMETDISSTPSCSLLLGGKNSEFHDFTRLCVGHYDSYHCGCPFCLQQL